MQCHSLLYDAEGYVQSLCLRFSFILHFFYLFIYLFIVLESILSVFKLTRIYSHIPI
jgi:hypothetical protein